MFDPANPGAPFNPFPTASTTIPQPQQPMIPAMYPTQQQQQQHQQQYQPYQTTSPPPPPQQQQPPLQVQQFNATLSAVPAPTAINATQNGGPSPNPISPFQNQNIYQQQQQQHPLQPQNTYQQQPPQQPQQQNTNQPQSTDFIPQKASMMPPQQSLPGVGGNYNNTQYSTIPPPQQPQQPQSQYPPQSLNNSSLDSNPAFNPFGPSSTASPTLNTASMNSSLNSSNNSIPPPQPQTQPPLQTQVPSQPQAQYQAFGQYGVPSSLSRGPQTVLPPVPQSRPHVVPGLSPGIPEPPMYKYKHPSAQLPNARACGDFTTTHQICLTFRQAYDKNRKLVEKSKKNVNKQIRFIPANHQSAAYSAIFKSTSNQTRAPAPLPQQQQPEHRRSIRTHTTDDTNRIQSDEMKICYNSLQKLMAQDKKQVFSQPVNPQLHGCPDYFNIIKNPMDFGQIRTDLLSGKINNVPEFKEKVNLVLQNAMTFNPPGHEVNSLAQHFKRMFENIYAECLRAPKVTPQPMFYTAAVIGNAPPPPPPVRAVKKSRESTGPAAPTKRALKHHSDDDDEDHLQASTALMASSRGGSNATDLALKRSNTNQDGNNANGVANANNVNNSSANTTTTTQATTAPPQGVAAAGMPGAPVGADAAAQAQWQQMMMTMMMMNPMMAAGMMNPAMMNGMPGMNPAAMMNGMPGMNPSMMNPMMNPGMMMNPMMNPGMMMSPNGMMGMGMMGNTGVPTAPPAKTKKTKKQRTEEQPALNNAGVAATIFDESQQQSLLGPMATAGVGAPAAMPSAQAVNPTQAPVAQVHSEQTITEEQIDILQELASTLPDSAIDGLLDILRESIPNLDPDNVDVSSLPLSQYHRVVEYAEKAQAGAGPDLSSNQFTPSSSLGFSSPQGDGDQQSEQEYEQ